MNTLFSVHDNSSLQRLLFRWLPSFSSYLLWMFQTTVAPCVYRSCLTSCLFVYFAVIERAIIVVKCFVIPCDVRNLSLENLIFKKFSWKKLFLVTLRLLFIILVGRTRCLSDVFQYSQCSETYFTLLCNNLSALWGCSDSQYAVSRSRTFVHQLPWQELPFRSFDLTTGDCTRISAISIAARDSCDVRQRRGNNFYCITRNKWLRFVRRS